MTALAQDVEAFIREARVAALATVRPNGRPHVTPVWYDYDGHEFIVGTFRHTQKLANIAGKGFAALCIHTQQVPYQQVIVEGTARIGSPLDNVWRERVASRYLGELAGRAYARDTADWDSVAIHIRPLKWATQGFESSQEG
jgi:hypothetical protein